MINKDSDWLKKFKLTDEYKGLIKRPIAYFCAEYALTGPLSVYAGGLGILSGDYLREAEDQDIPIVAIGLFYTKGYPRKELSKVGGIVDLHETLTPQDAGLKEVLDSVGQPVYIQVPLMDRHVTVKVWEYEFGNTLGKKTVKLYLLSTNVPENTYTDQHITDTLYVADKEIRFQQEIILGVGGLRVLEKLGHHPSRYHLNEGHSALLVFELIRHEMEEHQISFEKAIDIAKKRMLFTNHTLEPAGHDIFSNDMVALQLSGLATEMAVPVQKLVEVGLVQQSSTFSMTMLALRMSGKINGVSESHSVKAKEIWTDHPIIPITNGIHIPTWDKIKNEDNIWEEHQENKRELLSLINKSTGVDWDEKTIILGWARRMVRYKRPLAITEQLARFAELARKKERPIHLVYSGSAGFSDSDGVHMLEELQSRSLTKLEGVAVYLPRYTMELSAKLIAGCDVWLNTPVVGSEACGTSGMKAALNGVLPLTTIDGWIGEVNLNGVGWAVDSDTITENLLHTLEKSVLPLYYDTGENGVSRKWLGMMKNARGLVMDKFSMTRTIRRYLEEGLGYSLD